MGFSSHGFTALHFASSSHPQNAPPRHCLLLEPHLMFCWLSWPFALLNSSQKPAGFSFPKELCVSWQFFLQSPSSKAQGSSCFCLQPPFSCWCNMWCTPRRSWQRGTKRSSSHAVAPLSRNNGGLGNVLESWSLYPSWKHGSSSGRQASIWCCLLAPLQWDEQKRMRCSETSR